MASAPFKTVSFSFMPIKILTIILVGIALIVGVLVYFNFPVTVTKNSRQYTKKEYRLGSGSKGSKGNFSNLKTFIQQLQKDGIVRNANFMYGILRFSGRDKKVKAGYYRLNSGMSTARVIAMLVQGKESGVKIRIIEGHDIYDISETLVKNKVIASTDEALAFFKSTWARHFVEQKLNIKIKYSVEGFLYPDTYYLGSRDTITNLFLLSFNNFMKEIIPVYKQYANANDRSLYVLLKNASLVEKETALAVEKPIVASIVYNRLNKKMKLRYCSTIIYALKEKNLYYQNFKDGAVNIKQEHFTFDSPFNTYYYLGLPLTPIGNPSLQSFTAALNPKPTKYLFFVAKGDNSASHYFSDTYQQHKRYIQKSLNTRKGK